MRLGWPSARFNRKVGRVAQVCSCAHSVEGEPAHERHVLGAMPLAHARQILLEGHVERPVQGIFDAPVAADGVSERGRGATAGRDVIAGVEPRAILQLGSRINLDDRAGVDEAHLAGKAPVAVEPVDLPQHRDGAGFDAAVALVDIDVDFDLALVGGFEGGLDIGLKGRLIAFDGEQVVGPGVADGFCDLRIAGDGVDGDHGAFEAAAGGEFLEQQGDGGRFVGLAVDRLLSENQTAVGGEGGDQMQRGPSRDRSWLRRTVLPSMAIASSGSGQQARTQSIKQAANRSGSIRFIMMLSQRPEGTPQSKVRNRRRNPRWALPQSEMASKLSHSAIVAHTHTSSTSFSLCATLSGPRLSSTREKQSSRSRNCEGGAG